MTGYVAERIAIEGLFLSAWTETPVSIEGVPFEPPERAPWVRIVLRQGEAQQASIGAPGSNAFRHAGVVMVSIFVPILDDGISTTRPADELVDAATAIFRSKRAGGVVFHAPYVSDRHVDGSWLMTTVSVPYFRDSFF